MTWTYGGDPSANDRDEVRFLLGDTDTTDQLITDEEIAYAITQAATNRGAAALCARAVAASFARRADRTVGDLRISYSQQHKQYLELAERLESEAAYAVTPYAGGISKDDKETQEELEDRVDPAFRIGMQDNPRHSQTQRDPDDEL